MNPEELKALANRIDHEELWRRPRMADHKLSTEQKDRRDAAINLRRYADDIGTVLEQRKEGAQYIRGFRFERAGMASNSRGCGTHQWHVAINAFSDAERKAERAWPSWMYTAKMVSDEVPRMILLFEHERRGLAKSYKACAHDPRPATPLPDNHLRCALGKQCRACPYLLAIEAAAMTNEAKDEAKAWTCATHILLESQTDLHLDEQFLWDKSDDAFRARMIESMSMGDPEDRVEPQSGEETGEDQAW